MAINRPSDGSVKVTSIQLAYLWDCDPKTVRSCARNGIAVKTTRGQYLFDVSNRNYIKHLREIAAGRGVSAETGANAAMEENVALKRVRRTREQLKLLVDQGQLLSLSDVKDTWSILVKKTRDAVLSIPDQIAEMFPDMSREDVIRVRDICSAALKATALGKANSQPVMPSTGTSRKRKASSATF